MTKKKKERNNKKNCGAPRRQAGLVDEQTALATMLTANPLKSRHELPTGEPPIPCRDLTFEELKRRIQLSNEPMHRKWYETGRAALASLMNPKDDTNRVIDFIEAGGNIDPKRLAKRMPHTIKDMKEKKIDKKDFVDKTRNLLWVKPVCIGLSLPLNKIAFCALSSVRDSGPRETFSALLGERTEELLKKDTSDGLPTLAKCIKRATDLTCESMAAVLDQHFFLGIDGAFLRTCPAYRQPISHFESFLLSYEASSGFQIATSVEGDEISEEQRLLTEKVACALISILAFNLEEVKKSCWECGETPEDPDDLKTCGGCVIANYCGKECQEKAWWSGHKQQCKHLPGHYSNFDLSWQAFTDAHSNPEDNLRLSESSDFGVMFQIQRKPPQIPSDFGGIADWQVASEPSMETFYANMRGIQNGDFWIWKNPGPLEDYNAKFMSADEEEEVFNAFFSISDFLCYRFEQKNGSGQLPSSSDQDTYWKIADACGLSGLAMPVEKYLDLYLGESVMHIEKRIYAYSTQTTWHRRSFLLWFFRKWAHKGLLPRSKEEREKLRKDLEKAEEELKTIQKNLENLKNSEREVEKRVEELKTNKYDEQKKGSSN